MTSDSSDGTGAIEIRHLTVSYGPTPALLDVTLSLPQGKLIGILGPNGSGKSTLMKAILGFTPIDFGEMAVFGRPLHESKGKVAYVPQRGTVDWDFPISVREVVLMGRFGRVPWWRDLSKEDYAIADQSLEMVRMADFRDRQIGRLSGGQQQRVFMARALCQGAEILLLDEPFAGVDAATERAILEVMQQTRNNGKTLVVVHHDLATAAEYFDWIVLMKQRVFAVGPPSTVLTQSLLTQVYEGRVLFLSPEAPGAPAPDARNGRGKESSHA